MPSPSQQFGSWAESQAEHFLRRRGYRILDRHLTSRFGEIDILAVHQGALVAVEVKARRSEKFGSASESVTQKKLERIELTLSTILSQSYWEEKPVRIDIVTVDSLKIVLIPGVSVC